MDAALFLTKLVASKLLECKRIYKELCTVCDELLFILNAFQKLAEDRAKENRFSGAIQTNFVRQLEMLQDELSDIMDDRNSKAGCCMLFCGSLCGKGAKGALERLNTRAKSLDDMLKLVQAESSNVTASAVEEMAGGAAGKLIPHSGLRAFWREQFKNDFHLTWTQFMGGLMFYEDELRKTFSVDLPVVFRALRQRLDSSARDGKISVNEFAAITRHPFVQEHMDIVDVLKHHFTHQPYTLLPAIVTGHQEEICAAATYKNLIATADKGGYVKVHMLVGETFAQVTMMAGISVASSLAFCEMEDKVYLTAFFPEEILGIDLWTSEIVFKSEVPATSIRSSIYEEPFLLCSSITTELYVYKRIDGISLDLNEDGFPPTLFSPYTRLLHEGTLSTIEKLCDQRHVATRLFDNGIHIWDYRLSQLKCVLPGTAFSRGIFYSPTREELCVLFDTYELNFAKSCWLNPSAAPGGGGKKSAIPVQQGKKKEGGLTGQKSLDSFVMGDRCVALYSSRDHCLFYRSNGDNSSNTKTLKKIRLPVSFSVCSLWILERPVMGLQAPLPTLVAIGMLGGKACVSRYTLLLDEDQKGEKEEGEEEVFVARAQGNIDGFSVDELYVPPVMLAGSKRWSGHELPSLETRQWNAMKTVMTSLSDHLAVTSFVDERIRIFDTSSTHFKCLHEQNISLTGKAPPSYSERYFKGTITSLAVKQWPTGGEGPLSDTAGDPKETLKSVFVCASDGTVLRFDFPPVTEKDQNDDAHDDTNPGFQGNKEEIALFIDSMLPTIRTGMSVGSILDLVFNLSYASRMEIRSKVLDPLRLRQQPSLSEETAANLKELLQKLRTEIRESIVGQAEKGDKKQRSDVEEKDKKNPKEKVELRADTCFLSSRHWSRPVAQKWLAAGSTVCSSCKKDLPSKNIIYQQCPDCLKITDACSGCLDPLPSETKYPLCNRCYDRRKSSMRLSIIGCCVYGNFLLVAAVQEQLLVSYGPVGRLVKLCARTLEELDSITHFYCPALCNVASTTAIGGVAAACISFDHIGIFDSTSDSLHRSLIATVNHPQIAQAIAFQDSFESSAGRKELETSVRMFSSSVDKTVRIHRLKRESKGEKVEVYAEQTIRVGRVYSIAAHPHYVCFGDRSGMVQVFAKRSTDKKFERLASFQCSHTTKITGSLFQGRDFICGAESVISIIRVEFLSQLDKQRREVKKLEAKSPGRATPEMSQSSIRLTRASSSFSFQRDVIPLLCVTPNLSSDFKPFVIDTNWQYLHEGRWKKLDNERFIRHMVEMTVPDEAADQSSESQSDTSWQANLQNIDDGSFACLEIVRGRISGLADQNDPRHVIPVQSYPALPPSESSVTTGGKASPTEENLQGQRAIGAGNCAKFDVDSKITLRFPEDVKAMPGFVCRKWLRLHVPAARGVTHLELVSSGDGNPQQRTFALAEKESKYDEIFWMALGDGPLDCRELTFVVQNNSGKKSNVENGEGEKSKSCSDGGFLVLTVTPIGQDMLKLPIPMLLIETKTSVDDD